MDADINVKGSPLSVLNHKSRILISTLLNPQKVIPSAQEKLPRDWRGLAALIKIPLEFQSSIHACEDKTGKVFDIWIQRADGTATIGQLVTYLHMLDRHDISDDLEELARQGLLITNVPEQHIQPAKQFSLLEELRDDLITTEDVRHGCPQIYHAYVLYATEDKDFVHELLQRMKSEGIKLCTEDDLLPGFTTQYGPVSRLISERCHRIILIYSPDFLRSSANNFYMDYAQAVGIETKQSKIIPCMYRECQLPSHLAYYHKLYYRKDPRPGYDFWTLLAKSLQLVPQPSSQSNPLTYPPASATASQQTTKLLVRPNGYRGASTDIVAQQQQTPIKCYSSNELHKLSDEDTRSPSERSQRGARDKQRTTTKIKKFFTRSFGGKKQKDPIMLENA